MTRINKKIQNDEDCYKQTSSDYCNRMTKIVTNKIQNEGDRDQQTSEWPGLEFTLWFFKRIARFLWAKERFALSKEWIAHRCSFVNSDECVALLKRETERREQLLILGHKKGKSSEKHTKNKNFFKQIACFLRVIRSNHDGITHVALFFVRLLFKMRDFERMSKRANCQPCAWQRLLPTNFRMMKIITNKLQNYNDHF